MPNLRTVDSPTAVTLPRASYGLLFAGYTGGGLLSQAVFAVHDNIYLGVSWNIDNLIGHENIKVNIPGASVKFKLTDGWKKFPLLIAIGYDYFYGGKDGRTSTNKHNPFNEVIYGPYLVFTKPLFLFKTEQHLHFGVQIPVQPKPYPNDASFFVAFDWPIGFFVPTFEISRIYWDFKRLDQILFNVGLKFNFLENFAIKVNLLIRIGQPVSRELAFEYANSF